jgi:hypothetical protein
MTPCASRSYCTVAPVENIARSLRHSYAIVVSRRCKNATGGAPVLRSRTRIRVGRLEHARLKSGLSDQRRLLIAGTHEHRRAEAEALDAGTTKSPVG